MFFFIIITIITSVLSAEHCNKEMKQGPYKIKNLDLIVPHETLDTETTKITVVETNYEQGAFMGFKGYYQAFGYQGGPLDWNTRLEEELKSIPLTRIELLDWYNRGSCEVGEDLINQWGSDSDKCFSGKEGRGVWVKHKELIKRSNNNHFAHHTCNRSWRCGFSTSKVYSELNCEEGKICEVKVMDDKGQAINVSTESVFYNGGVSMILLKKPEITVRKVMSRCITSDVRVENTENCYKRYCIIEGDVHEVTGDYKCKFNKCIKGGDYKCNYNIIAERGKWNSVSSKESGRAATIGDLDHLRETTIYENELLKFNLETLHNHLNKMSNLMHKIVNSVSKMDDKLIGNILSKDISTEFISTDTFFTLPCTSPPEHDSNCFNNSIFKDGRWIANDNPSLCIKLENYKNITIDDEIDFWVPSVGNSSFHDTWQDAPGWSFYAQQKDGLTTTMINTKWGGSTTSLSDVVNLPAGYLKSNLSGLLFGNVTLYLIVFVFILIFVNSIFCRR